MLIAAAMLAQSVLPDVPQKNIDKALAKAKPVATCQVGPDCDRRWTLARQWVLSNSRFTLLRDNDHQILTRFAIYANTDASYVVALDAPLNGFRTIRFRAWCGNWIKCYPSPETLTGLFVQAVNSPTP
jgi:hypothetical protein